MPSLADFLADQRHYSLIFIEAHGPFPHPCHFCWETVEPWAGRLDSRAPVVHHLDHDQTNNEPGNLVPAHHGCHTVYHHTGAKRAPEVGAKISAKKKGRASSAEHRAKLSAARKGKQLTAEHRAAIAAGKRGKPVHTAESRAKISAARKGQASPALVAHLRANTEAMKGKSLSAEHRAKISAGLRAAAARRKKAS